MKILVHSTAPWSPSSYSVLVSRTVPNMVYAGHNVTLQTWYGLQGQPLPWQIPPKNGKQGGKVTVLPSVAGTHYDNDAMLASYHFHNADVLMTVADV